MAFFAPWPQEKAPNFDETSQVNGVIDLTLPRLRISVGESASICLKGSARPGDNALMLNVKPREETIASLAPGMALMQTRVFTVTGKAAGETRIRALLLDSPMAEIAVVVAALKGEAKDVQIQSPFITNDFADGFIEGFKKTTAGSDVVLYQKLTSDPKGFTEGVQIGCLEGLLEGLVSLLKLLRDLAKLAVNLSPFGLLVNGVRYAFDSKFREEVNNHIANAKKVADAIAAFAMDVKTHPEVYFAMASSAKAIGVVVGEELGREVNDEVRKKSASELGKWVGFIIGRVAFEIIFIIATEGLGMAAQGAKVGGEGAGIAARLLPKLEKLIPGFAKMKSFLRVRLGLEFAQEAQWAARGAKLVLPSAGSEAKAVAGLWREGAAEAEMFAGRSGVKAADPAATGLTSPPRHILKPNVGEINEGLPRNFGVDPAELKKTSEGQKWLNSSEGKQWLKDREAYLKQEGLPKPGESELKGLTEEQKKQMQPPHPGVRAHDAEAKMFEDILAKTTRDTKGEVHFKADRPVCPACKDMIFRFTSERPNIKVIQHSPQ